MYFYFTRHILDCSRKSLHVEHTEGKKNYALSRFSYETINVSLITLRTHRTIFINLYYNSLRVHKKKSLLSAAERYPLKQTFFSNKLIGRTNWYIISEIVVHYNTVFPVPGSNFVWDKINYVISFQGQRVTANFFFLEG